MRDFQKMRDSVTLHELNRAFYALADFVIETTINIERRMDRPDPSEREGQRYWLTRQRRAMTSLANLFAKCKCDGRASLWHERAEGIEKKVEAKKALK